MLRMLGKMCSKCGNEPQLKQKTICKSCDCLRVAERRRTKGKWNGICAGCGIKVYVMKNEFKLCFSCYTKKVKEDTNQTKYKAAKSAEYSKMHNRIATMLLGYDPAINDDVVHHINEDKEDNHPDNLLVISRAAHSNLHVFLRKFKATYTGTEPWENVRIIRSHQFVQLYGYQAKWLGSFYIVAPEEVKKEIAKLIYEQEEFNQEIENANSNDKDGIQG